MEPSTPRPTLELETILSDSALRKLRRKRRNLICSVMLEWLGDDTKVRDVLRKYRRRQTRLLGERDEDPNPYDSDYIFYCLEAPRG